MKILTFLALGFSLNPVPQAGENQRAERKLAPPIIAAVLHNENAEPRCKIVDEENNFLSYDQFDDFILTDPDTAYFVDQINALPECDRDDFFHTAIMPDGDQSMLLAGMPSPGKAAPSLLGLLWTWSKFGASRMLDAVQRTLLYVRYNPPASLVPFAAGCAIGLERSDMRIEIETRFDKRELDELPYYFGFPMQGSFGAVLGYLLHPVREATTMTVIEYGQRPYTRVVPPALVKPIAVGAGSAVAGGVLCDAIWSDVLEGPEP